MILPSRTVPTCRRQDIDTIRAIACVALVFYHVVGGGPANGLELAAGHWLHVITAAFSDIRMPLFSFVSGIVFTAAAPDLPGAVRRIAAKARRLLLPMACVGTLFWLVRHGMGIEQPPFAAIFLRPYEHFWFLQATFLIMTVFTLASWVSGGRQHAVAGALMVGGAVWWWGFPLVPGNWFSVNNALYLSVFFMAGHLLAGRTAGQGRGAGLVLLGLAVLTGLTLATGLWEPGPGLRRGLALGVGLAACLGLYMARPSHAALATLGRQSYAIYLFHVFFAAGMREGLVRLVPGIDPLAILPLALVAGLAGPILVQQALQRHDLGGHLFLGLRLRRSGAGQGMPVAPA